jgi:hypothetical protein
MLTKESGSVPDAWIVSGWMRKTGCGLSNGAIAIPIWLTGKVIRSKALPSRVSTSTSKRSPINTGSPVTFTGSASSPPSLAITYIGRLSLVEKFSERALQPFSKRAKPAARRGVFRIECPVRQ